MYKINKLNAISDAIYNYLPKDEYEVSTEFENFEAIIVRSAKCHDMQFPKELLAIARAAVADPPVLILDEATSSIDTRTERIVQDGMDKLMNGRTTFVIAHRLSTVRNSDCIMVLEQGRIIERGTHEQLVEEKGRYYQLYTGNSISA